MVLVLILRLRKSRSRFWKSETVLLIWNIIAVIIHWKIQLKSQDSSEPTFLRGSLSIYQCQILEGFLFTQNNLYMMFITTLGLIFSIIPCKVWLNLQRLPSIGQTWSACLLFWHSQPHIVLASTCLNKGGLKIEKIAFSKGLIVSIMVYHIGFRKTNVIFDF